MNKDELRIRIIPEDGQVLIETHTDGIVKCKAVQEDAFLDCIKNSAMRDYVNSGLLPSDCIHVKIHPNGNKEYCLWYPRLYADISYHETAYPSSEAIMSLFFTDDLLINCHLSSFLLLRWRKELGIVFTRKDMFRQRNR